MREGPANNPGPDEETLNKLIEQSKRIRDTLDFSDCYSDLTKAVIKIMNKQDVLNDDSTNDLI